jgi:3',5'-cyclic AMP phosphodiesterase CpdA
MGNRVLADNARNKGMLRLAVLNDLHHDSTECDPWFEAVVRAVSQIEPDGCILAGDLANIGLESSLRSVREIFGRLDCPVYPVPGNHDCDVTDDTSLYEEIFPGRLNYVIERAGWQLLFLDTTNGKAWQDVQISKRTLDWLESNLMSLDQTKPALVFTHFPLASPIHMAPVNTDAVWKRLAGLDVRAAFCGHYHGQHAVIRPPLVTTNICCARPGVRGNFDGDPRKGFWQLTADAENGKIDYRMVLLEQQAG